MQHRAPSPAKPFSQVFNFQHGLLFGKMNCLQVSAVYSMITPLMEHSFRGSAPTPVLQVTQGGRHTQQHDSHCEPTHLHQEAEGQVNELRKRLLKHQTMAVPILLPNLTVTNSAEEDIEEYTDKQRTQWHLPTMK